LAIAADAGDNRGQCREDRADRSDIGEERTPEAMLACLRRSHVLREHE
jgi:hypothetical protein